MKTKIILAAAAIAAISCIVAGALFMSSPATGTNPAEEIARPMPTTPAAETKSIVSAEPEKMAASADAALKPEKPDAHSNGAKQLELAPTEPPITINGYELQDPMARIALNLVGADPDANAYWIGAINDSALPAEERKDLIEDLNEDGLSDPRHPTAQDLPLILSRIRLIEQLMPSALDQVNRDALVEAYKDLVDLAGGKEPK